MIGRIVAVVSPIFPDQEDISLSDAPRPPRPDRWIEADAVPGSRAEITVILTLVPGLDRVGLDAVLARVNAALVADETVAGRVDSLELRLRAGA